MEPSIFTRIINGEIPCHKIYEDDKVLAFLDIHPAQPGHTLVVPKNQMDRLEDLPDEDYSALMSATKKIMQQVRRVLGEDFRACLRLEGFDVAHAHLHVIPCRSAADFWAKGDQQAEPNHDQLAKLAERLRF